jgi:peroxiredoxin
MRGAGRLSLSLDSKAGAANILAETLVHLRSAGNCSMRICFIWLLLGLVFCTTSAFAALKSGDTAPDFTARSLDGKTIQLRDFKGRRLLIEMGTTWCPTCKKLAHQLDGIRAMLREKDVVYLSVFLADSADSVRTYFENEKLEWPDQVLVDQDSARSAYGVFTIPRLILVDTDFKIVFDEVDGGLAQLKEQLNL